MRNIPITLTLPENLVKDLHLYVDKSVKKKPRIEKRDACTGISGS